MFICQKCVVKIIESQTRSLQLNRMQSKQLQKKIETASKQSQQKGGQASQQKTASKQTSSSSQSCCEVISKAFRTLAQKAINFLECNQVYDEEFLEELKRRNNDMDKESLSVNQSLNSLSNTREETNSSYFSTSNATSKKKNALPEDYYEIPLKNYSLGKSIRFGKKYAETYQQSYDQRKGRFLLTFEEVEKIRAIQFMKKEKVFCEELKRFLFCRGGNQIEDIDELETSAESAKRPNFSKLPQNDQQAKNIFLHEDTGNQFQQIKLNRNPRKPAYLVTEPKFQEYGELNKANKRNQIELKQQNYYNYGLQPVAAVLVRPIIKAEEAAKPDPGFQSTETNFNRRRNVNVHDGMANSSQNINVKDLKPPYVTTEPMKGIVRPKANNKAKQANLFQFENAKEDQDVFMDSEIKSVTPAKVKKTRAQVRAIKHEENVQETNNLVLMSNTSLEQKKNLIKLQPPVEKKSSREATVNAKLFDLQQQKKQVKEAIVNQPPKQPTEKQALMRARKRNRNNVKLKVVNQAADQETFEVEVQ